MPEKRDSERGAVAAIFAILLGAGALMLVLGLVIDGGLVYAQKKNVQAAADDLSSSIAQHCAKTAASTDCFNNSYAVQGTTYVATASTVASTDVTAAIANPKGGGIVVSNVCGKSATWSGMPGCASPTGGSRDCQTDLGALGYQNWVRVYTSTDPTGVPADLRQLHGLQPEPIHRVFLLAVLLGSGCHDAQGHQLRTTAFCHRCV